MSSTPWFGPPNPHHPMGQHQQGGPPPPPPSHGGHFQPPPSAGGQQHQQRMPPLQGGGSTGAGVNGNGHVQGGTHSPHPYPPPPHLHQRGSPPPMMKGIYHHHPHAHPYNGGGNMGQQQQQHPHHGPPGGHGKFQNHHGQHQPAMPSNDASARHEASSPGMPAMPPLRLPMPPPNSATRPIPQQPGNGSGGPPTSRGGHYDQVGPSPAMQQHMMRLQHEHRQQQQHHHQQHYHSGMMQAHHFHHPHPAAPSPQSFTPSADFSENDPSAASGADENGTNNASSSNDNHSVTNGGDSEAPSSRVQRTPDQRPTSATSRSPSPSGIPVPPVNYQDSATVATDNGSQRESPASSMPDHSESSGRAGPLRESRVHNTMPPKRMMMPMQHPPMHAQRPHPQHPNGGMNMNLNHPPYPHSHHYNHPPPYPNGHHYPHQHHPYMNENMDRYRGMEHDQQKHHMGGGPPGSQQMKSMQYHRQQQQQQMMMHHQQQQQRVNVMQSPPGQKGPPPPPPPPPPRPKEGSQKKKQQEQQQQPGTKKKKGPDVTMDAASMLLSLRASASPSTVASGALEEQGSQDQAEEGGNSKTTKGKKQDQSENDGMDDDTVPTLTSSSSSLSAGPPKPPLCPPQEHEVPKNFPSRLALPNDEAKLNSLHCFLRSELLEIFVVERSANKSPTHSPGSSVGRVGLRCVFCAMARKRNAVNLTGEAARDHDLTSSSASLHRSDEAPMAVFYPKSIAEIYRLVTSWQRCHLRKCRNLPPDIRSKWTLLRENDKSRGKTHYWITSAKEIGLVDCQSRAGGIRFTSSRSNSGGGSLVASCSADSDSMAGTLYSVSHSHSEDSAQGGSADKSSSYQPHNNPHFVEGPSQKHREAAAQSVSTPSVSVVESPMKESKTTPTTTSEPKDAASTAASSSQDLATPVRV